LLLLAGARFALADDFSGKQVQSGTKVVPGSLLDCDALDLLTLEQRHPKAYQWALAAGLIDQSSITGGHGYSDKISTKDALGRRTLLIGCWVTQKILKERINGEEKVYAQGAYRINDAIKESPLIASSVCEKKKRVPGYKSGDYALQGEGHSISCKADQWHDVLPSLSALETKTELFELFKSSDKLGYVWFIGF
jgi:hypothetical protein